jgi:hypothetical protein
MMHMINHQTSNQTTSVTSAGEYDSRYGVDPINRQLVQGYTQMVTDRIEQGWTCDLLTFLFSQCPGTRPSVISQMKDEIQRVYSTFLTRVHREPRTALPDTLPVLIGAADLPVYKHDRATSPMVLCNSGLHFHALMLVPATSRLEGPVDEHFQHNDGLYRGRHRTIQSIHTRPVTDSYKRVVDYVFKTVLRGRVPYDEGILLLPRAIGELIRD